MTYFMERSANKNNIDMKKKSIRFFIFVTLCMALSGCKHEPKAERQQETAEMEEESDTVIREGIYALPGTTKWIIQRT